MNKITLAVMAIGTSFIASAATINWSSGVMQTPTSATDGTLSGNKITSSSGYAVTMYAFESLSAISYDAGDLFKWYQEDPSSQFKGLTAIDGTVSMGASATTATARGVISEDAGTTVYGAVLFVLTDSVSGKDLFYMENDGSIATAKSTKSLGSLALKIGGTGAAMAWTAVPSDVPEPTSAMLMLLGMAGLALRRKRT